MSKKDAEKLITTSPEKAEDLAEELTDIEAAAHQGAVSPYEGIAVLGSHPHTIGKAPWGKNWRFYACSPHNIEMRTLPVVHEWFEVHLPATHPTRNYEYLRRLEDNNVAQNPMHAEVIWARDKEFLARCRDAREYPEEEYTKIFGPFFWTSSIAFMMARAIMECQRLQIPKLGLWGIMQASENEYTYQRPGIQYFIQRASEAGIQVLAPPESRLFEPQEVEF